LVTKIFNRYGIVISDYILFWVVLGFLILPYFALKYSYLPIVGSINALFITLVLISVFLLWLRSFKTSKKVFGIMMILFFLLMYGVVKGVLSGYPVSEVLKSGYYALIPLVLLGLILLSRIVVLNTRVALIYPVLLFGFCDAIYSIYQYFGGHDYTLLWFYAPLTSQGFELHEWSFEHEGIIRSPGFFTSALENAFFISIVSLYFTVSLIIRKKIN